MTIQQRRGLTLAVLGAVLAGLITPVLLGAWDAKVGRPEFDLHRQDVLNWRVNHVQADSAWRREQRELTMELLCEVKPQSRHC
jgi:hypothetical protein